MTTPKTLKTVATLGAMALAATGAATTVAAGLAVEGGASPDFLDPALARDALAWQVLGATQGGLLAYRRSAGTAGARLVPDLAAALPTVSRDGRTLTFTLRGNVRFAGGTTRVAEASDAKASLERILLLDSRGADLFMSIAGARAVHAGTARSLSGVAADDTRRRLVIRLTRRDPALLEALALPFAAVLPAGTPAVDQTTDPPAGIGPYVITEFDPGERIILERNRQYVARPGLPAGVTDRITIALGNGAEPAARRVASGAADYSAVPVPPGSTGTGGYAHGATPHRVVSSSTAYIALDASRSPFRDARIRRAVGLALDRGAAARAIAGGARPAGRMIPPGTPGHSSAIPGQATREARSLVASAGRTGTSVVIWTSTEPVDRAVANAGRDAMRRAGLSPVVRTLSRNGGLGSNVPDAIVASATWDQTIPDGSDAYAGLLGQRAPGSPADPPVPAISGTRSLRASARAASVAPLGTARDDAWARVDAAAVSDGHVIPVATPVATQVTARGVRGVTAHPVLGVLLAPLSPPS